MRADPGPKTIALLHRKHHVNTVDDLVRVLGSNALARTPGFGERKISALRESLKSWTTSEQRMLLGLALPRAEELVGKIRKLRLVGRVEPAGSLRRGCETIGDVDLPALIIVLAKSAGTQAAEDCCLAAENLMLAARNEGLGSCWIGFARPWQDLPGTKAELKLPAHYHVVAPIVLGYPKAWPESHGRSPAETYWL